MSYEQEDVATIVGWNEKIGTLPPTGDHVSNLQSIEILEIWLGVYFRVQGWIGQLLMA